MALLAELGSWAVASGSLAAGWRMGATRREALARAAHELRGPLTAIGLGLGAGQPAALELELRRAQAALEDLDALAGRGRLRRRRAVDGAPRRLEVVALDELAAASAAAWSTLAAMFGAELVPPPPTGELATVLGDPARLAQATGNLIANALEHGGGQVRVRCRALDSAVRIEVSDHGPGLPAPVEAMVGRRRGWRERGSRHGHGLRVAASVAAAHGGRLSAAPAEVGARLVLELPRYPG